jgi:hypothetical protein
MARLRRRVANGWLTLEAGWLAVVFEVGLRVVPFTRVRAFAQRGAASRRAPPAVADVRNAAHRAYAALPFESTCLKRSLIVCRMLRHRGVAARVCIGARREAGLFEAHAWVEDPGGAPLTDPQEGFAAFPS